MLVYTSYGVRDFGADPATPKMRSAWEFWVLLSGNINFHIESLPECGANRPTMFVFPPGLRFGCDGNGVSSRAVFDFTVVPTELADSLPACGYYRVAIDERDADRITQLARMAASSVDRPTNHSSLEQQAALMQLSLLSLRDAKVKALRGKPRAEARIEQALAYYATNMTENPTLADIGEAIHVSSSHLRRLFHEVMTKSPKAAFDELRMERTQTLLAQSDLSMEEIAARVGLADASALSRAVKQHLGIPPGKLRKLRRQQLETGWPPDPGPRKA